ncbi:high-affinity choline transporter 1-like [Clavelina lepadiformis]|uniref:high-affinity choline transporter 1-like n=1 Tax=Clavelina lepadiformis TaxID=159417 RepID=UPI0040425F97
MAVNIPGLISLIVFYLLIMVFGFWGAWMKRKRGINKSEANMVANRDIGLLLGCFTMTATWVGGGYLLGTSESIYTPGMGLLWTQPPFCYSLSVLIGGCVFAKEMRRQGYVTMIDPFQRKLGRFMGALVSLPAICGEMFFAGAILSALGATLVVIVGISHEVAVITSACIAVFYTLFGGLYSVAYTDVAQLIFMFFGMWLSIPFIFTNDALIAPITETAYWNQSWLGSWDMNLSGKWIDSTLMLIGGGIPWQCYFQRVLSAKTPTTARTLSIVSCFGCIFMSTPSILIGAAASSINWTATTYGPGTPLENGEEAMILPICLQYLTPHAVAFFGLGAAAAAVMSSADSSILALASMTTRNFYQPLIRPQASERELIWVMRVGTVLAGIVPTVCAIKVKSVFALWFLCSDLIYAILLPQLIAVVYFDPNSYGALPAYIYALIMRLGGGESFLGVPPFINYPGNVFPDKANFPFKTFTMITSLIMLLSISYAAKFLFEKGYIPAKYDFFDCKLAYGGRKIELVHLESKASKDESSSTNQKSEVESN